ncbi:MAG TPA: hypothetical protein VN081_03395 [Dongiaceae bacterium]|nr:hypothetical protein [Dongiaceae bacterium]
MERPTDNPNLIPFKTWEAAAYDKEKGDWVHTELHSYEHKNSRLLIQPVELAPIPPDRRKPPKRDHNVIMVFSDAQIGYRRIDDELVPLHDESAIKAMLKFAYHLQPNVVVDNGDTTDFAELSRFAPDSDHFQGTIQPSLQRTHNLFAEVSAVTPGAKRVTVWSNHVKRLTDYLLKNAPALYNVKAAGEKYPALSYPGLLKLDQIGWDYVDGYPGEWRYAQDLAFMHGTFAVSNGSTANKLSRANYGRNVVQGHKHSIESHYHTDRRGKAFGAFVVGALCRIDGVVPSYHNSVGVDNQPIEHYENWQQGLMVIHDYGDGVYDFRQVPIHDGKIYYDGKEYDGNL